MQLATKPPAATLYSLCECCGGTNYFVASDGRVLAEGAFGEDAAVTWSPDGRYVAGITLGETSNTLWVGDSIQGRIALRRRLNSINEADTQGPHWVGNRVVKVHYLRYRDNAPTRLIKVKHFAVT